MKKKFKTCLPYPKLQTFHSDGNEVVVIGWGVTEENGDVSRTLQNVRIYLYEPDQCLNSTYEIKTNWDSQLCAGKEALKIEKNNHKI